MFTRWFSEKNLKTTWLSLRPKCLKVWSHLKIKTQTVNILTQHQLFSYSFSKRIYKTEWLVRLFSISSLLVTSSRKLVWISCRTKGSVWSQINSTIWDFCHILGLSTEELTLPRWKPLQYVNFCQKVGDSYALSIHLTVDHVVCSTILPSVAALSLINLINLWFTKIYMIFVLSMVWFLSITSPIYLTRIATLWW